MGLPTDEELAYIRRTSVEGRPNMQAVGSPGSFHSPYVWNKLFPFEVVGAYPKSLKDEFATVPENFDWATVSDRQLKDKMYRKGKFDGTQKVSVHEGLPPLIRSKILL
jgi:hypothetical protein